MPINLFSRDTQYDVGNEPSDPGIDLWQSPDIIPRHTQCTDPTMGGMFDDVPAVDDIRPAQNNFVYTRIRSKDAAGTATNVKAKLWWAEPGTLAMPSAWNPIGNTVDVTGPSGATIQANEFPRIAEFTWQAALVPATGHFCLVSSIWSDDDPEESVTDVPVLGFSEWVRYKNNVAWRNLNVVASTPVTPPLPSLGGHRRADDFFFFRMWANTPGGEEDAIMQLGLTSKLPAGSLVEMEGNQDFLQRINPLRRNASLVSPVHPEIAAAFSRPFVPRRGVLGKFERFDMTHRMPLRFDRVMRLTPTKFAANRLEKVALNVWIPKTAMHTDVAITLTQEFQNRTIGGMTWKLARPSH